MVRFGKAGLKSIESLPEPFFTPETRLKPNEKIYFIKVDRLNAITSVAIQTCNGSQVNAIRMVFKLISFTWSKTRNLKTRVRLSFENGSVKVFGKARNCEYKSMAASKNAFKDQSELLTTAFSGEIILN